MGKLTASQVEGLIAPGRSTDGDGLMPVIDSAGRKYWHLRYTHAGKRRDLSLGPARTVSLRQAREAALEARLQIRKGGDPVARRKAAEASEMRFADAARAVHASLQKGWRNGKHCNQRLTTLENHALPLIGDRPIASLTRADMVDVLSPIRLSHQETARRVLQRISTAIESAVGARGRENGVDLHFLSRALDEDGRLREKCLNETSPPWPRPAPSSRHGGGTAIWSGRTRNGAGEPPSSAPANRAGGMPPTPLPSIHHRP